MLIYFYIRSTDSQFCYKMTHKNQGKCLLFIHENFNLMGGKVQPAQLKCADDKIKLLKSTFEKIKFKVISYKDLCLNEIKKVLESRKYRMLLGIHLDLFL